MKRIPVVSIVGRSGCGKTTLIEKMIHELKARGYRVGTVKHHSHPGISMDKPGKDTWRHAQAGSDHVLIAAPDQVVSIRKVSCEPTLEELVSGMTDVDVILTEGYMKSAFNRIEIVRRERSVEPLCEPESLLALATDVDVPYDLPQYGLDDAGGLVDLVLRLVGKKAK